MSYWTLWVGFFGGGLRRRTLDVGEGRRGRVTGLEDSGDGLTHSPVSNSLVQASERGVVTTLEGGHELL